MTGFMGMGMAGQAGGANMQNLYQMGAQQQAAQSQAAPKLQAASGSGTWKCECGAENTGKFCSECGKPKPQPAEWACSCGHFIFCDLLSNSIAPPQAGHLYSFKSDIDFPPRTVFSYCLGLPHSAQNLPVFSAPQAHFQLSPAGLGSGFLLPQLGQKLPVMTL